MATLADDEVEPSARSATTAENLLRAVLTLGDPLFAVVDGGQFDDLPALLRGLGLPCRSLFLEHADPEVEQAGPWLAPLTSEGEAERALSIDDVGWASVFWSCAAGEAALFRHLRSLNLVEIPNAFGPVGEPAMPAGPGYQQVMFRHWDPHVFGLALPTLEPAQFARALGPAQAVMTPAADARLGYRLAKVYEGMPPASRGPLRFSPQQMMRMQRGATDASTKAVMGHLRDCAPELVEGLDDDALARHVVNAKASGAELGLSADDELGDWAFLTLVNDGRLAKDRNVRDYIKSGAGGTADDRKAKPGERLAALIEYGAKHGDEAS